MTTDNTAPPAPTPGPVIVEAYRYAQSMAVTERARGRQDEERAWLDLLHLLDTAAETPRPEPVVAGDLGEFPGDDPTGCCHTPGGHGLDRRGCHRCFVEGWRSEPVAAPPLSEAVDALAEVIWTASRADESTISAIGAQHVARAVVAAGYRLVPEDDEDTVRVPRSISDSWAMDLWWKVTGDNWPVPEHMPGKFLRHFLHILENGGTR